MEERVFILESYLKTMYYVYCRQRFFLIWKASASEKCYCENDKKNFVKQVHFWTRIEIGRSQC